MNSTTYYCLYFKIHFFVVKFWWQNKDHTLECLSPNPKKTPPPSIKMWPRPYIYLDTWRKLLTALEMEAYGTGQTTVPYRLCCKDLPALIYWPGQLPDRASVLSGELQAGGASNCFVWLEYSPRSLPWTACIHFCNSYPDFVSRERAWVTRVPGHAFLAWCMTDGCGHLLSSSSSWKFHQFPARQLLSEQPVLYGKGRRYDPSIMYKITPARSLSSSQPDGPPSWSSPLAFGLIGCLSPKFQSSLSALTLAIHLCMHVTLCMSADGTWKGGGGMFGW